jgi:hypothetical protein
VGGIAQLEQLTGLPAQEIDHVILGLKVDDRLPPRLILLVQTLRPFSKTQLKEKLKAGRFPDPDAIRFPSDRTFVFGLTPKDVEAIPSTPSSGIGHLPAPIQTALRERIDKSARIWVIGASDEWDKTVVAGYFMALSKETKDVLKKVQIFAIGLRMEHEPTLTAGLKCSNESGARALNEYLRKQKIESLRDVTVNNEGPWVTLQGKIDLDDLRSMFKQTINVHKK